MQHKAHTSTLVIAAILAFLGKLSCAAASPRQVALDNPSVFLSARCSQKEVTPKNVKKLFGFWGSAIHGIGTGNYISDVAAVSNVVIVSGPNPDELASKLQDATKAGMRAVIFIQRDLFGWGVPKFDEQSRTKFRQLWEAASSSGATIEAFYIYDEPYLDTSGAFQALRNKEDTYRVLSEAVNYVKSLAPCIPIFVNFSHLETLLEGFPLGYAPENADWIGFDCYIEVGPPCSVANVEKIAYKILNSKRLGQKLVLIPDAFRRTSRHTVSEADLVARIEFYYNLAVNDEVVAVFPFIFQNTGDIIGAGHLPQVLAAVFRFSEKLATEDARNSAVSIDRECVLQQHLNCK